LKTTSERGDKHVSECSVSAQVQKLALLFSR